MNKKNLTGLDNAIYYLAVFLTGGIAFVWKCVMKKALSEMAE